MDDRMIHLIQFLTLIVGGIVLILFGHEFISPDLVFTAMIASSAGVVGTRIAQNGYARAPTTPPTKGVPPDAASPTA